MQISFDYGAGEKQTFDLHCIIDNRDILVLFQPVILVAKKRIFGLEGLVRGIDRITNEIISPIDMFNVARELGKTGKLDIACREKVMEAFSEIYKHHRNILLFLNIDASIIGEEGSALHIKALAESFGIDTGNIVIEVNESRVKDTEILKKFINSCREFGILIAMDDVGAGFSNLDRIPIIKPDIIKVDMSLVKNIHQDHYKQEIFKTLVNLCNRVGSLVVAEGTETEEEVMQILELGAHMIQGFYFSKPQSMDESILTTIKGRVAMTTSSFKQYMSHKIREEKLRYKTMDNIVNRVLMDLLAIRSEEFDYKLVQIAEGNKRIECMYILDEYGIQISNTICLCELNHCKKNLIFNPAEKGTDHSMRKYYYRLINARLNKYITDAYISMATGNPCTTISKTFRNSENKKFILCIDINPNCVSLPFFHSLLEPV